MLSMKSSFKFNACKKKEENSIANLFVESLYCTKFKADVLEYKLKCCLYFG